MPDVDVVTDPDVLALYVGRAVHESDPGKRSTHMIAAMVRLEEIATGAGRDGCEWARWGLTRIGEDATPLPDEGAPCG